MPECLAFDLYDDRWRDCWIAATSVARLRKKQVDIDIQQRVARLLEDYGPQSEKPLTLRIYGTMIKGFCVINNERARALCCDCERVVFMFAQKPFAEGDNTIRLPNAKRPRMEAALTLDLNLARVEASEAFDWTEVPLEEGALLRLSGVQPGNEALPPSLDLFAGPGFGAEGAADGLNGLAAGLGDLIGGPAADAGWLPTRLPGEGEELHPPPPPAAGPEEPLMSQLVPSAVQVPDVDARGEASAQEGPPPDVQGLTIPVVPPPAPRRPRETFSKPGIVYGFDDEPLMSSQQYEAWQQTSGEITGGRLRPRGYAECMADEPWEKAEHLGPHLRLLVDPMDSKLSWQAPGAAVDAVPTTEVPSAGAQGQTSDEFPDMQNLLSSDLQADRDSVMQPPEPGHPPEDLLGGTLVEHGPSSFEDEFSGIGAGNGAAEAQDQRTAEVGGILRGCLRRGSARAPVTCF